MNHQRPITRERLVVGESMVDGSGAFVDTVGFREGPARDHSGHQLSTRQPSTSFWSLGILWPLVLGAWSLWQASLASAASPNPIPLLHAHAHNDYEHARPLFEALDHGFCSVEADIYLVDGQLLVAHDREKVSPDRTLQTLYLEPLRARARRNAGRIFPNGPDVTLLIDVKADGEATYAALR